MNSGKCGNSMSVAGSRSPSNNCLRWPNWHWAVADNRKYCLFEFHIWWFADCVSQNGINEIYENAFIQKFRRLNSRLHYNIGAGEMVVMRIFNSKLPEKKGHFYPYISLLWQYIAPFIRHPASVQMKLKRIESKISKVNFHWHAWHAFDPKTAEYCVKNTENNHLCSSQTAICSTDSMRPPSEEFSHSGEKNMETNFVNIVLAVASIDTQDCCYCRMLNQWIIYLASLYTFKEALSA